MYAFNGLVKWRRITCHKSIWRRNFLLLDSEFRIHGFGNCSERNLISLRQSTSETDGWNERAPFSHPPPSQLNTSWWRLGLKIQVILPEITSQNLVSPQASVSVAASAETYPLGKLQRTPETTSRSRLTLNCQNRQSIINSANYFSWTPSSSIRTMSAAGI